MYIDLNRDPLWPTCMNGSWYYIAQTKTYNERLFFKTVL